MRYCNQSHKFVKVRHNIIVPLIGPRPQLKILKMNSRVMIFHKQGARAISR